MPALSVRLPDDLHEAARVVAGATRVSLNALIERALRTEILRLGARELCDRHAARSRGAQEVDAAPDQHGRALDGPCEWNHRAWGQPQEDLMMTMATSDLSRLVAIANARGSTATTRAGAWRYLLRDVASIRPLPIPAWETSTAARIETHGLPARARRS